MVKGVWVISVLMASACRLRRPLLLVLFQAVAMEAAKTLVHRAK